MYEERSQPNIQDNGDLSSHIETDLSDKEFYQVENWYLNSETLETTELDGDDNEWLKSSTEEVNEIENEQTNQNQARNSETFNDQTVTGEVDQIHEWFSIYHAEIKPLTDNEMQKYYGKTISIENFKDLPKPKNSYDLDSAAGMKTTISYNEVNQQY